MAKPVSDRPLRPATLLVRGGLMRSNQDETSEALYLTSGFVYDSAQQAEQTFTGEVQKFQYSRFGNPTISMLEERLALLEGAEACRVTATGMAAVSAALLAHLKTGDRVVASRALFGSCYWIVSTLLPRYGIQTEFVDGADLEQWKAALKRPCQLVLLETPSNPMLELVDLAAVSELAHKAGAIVVVDNVFATPLLQRPLKFGADVVVYSLTKHFDGQGRVLGGAVLGNKKWVEEVLQPFTRNTGPAMSAFNAWTILKGMETLHLRVPAMCRSAAAIAQMLEEREEVARVYYPFLASHPQYGLAKQQMAAGGSLVSFDIKGGKEATFRFLDALRVIDISNNLGDAKSLVTHPATTTHSKVAPEERARLGISDGSVRLSVGLEDVADLIEDIATALDAAAGTTGPRPKSAARMVVEEASAAAPERAPAAKTPRDKREPAAPAEAPARAARQEEPDLFAEAMQGLFREPQGRPEAEPAAADPAPAATPAKRRRKS
ncbi:O-succinylhomoserine sulfhydrylase (plasmid) [Roseomonas marmotae]|nr:O-succinylhomoserine sulfhydrylase [Roseomonas marmotae]